MASPPILLGTAFAMGALAALGQVTLLREVLVAAGGNEVVLPLALAAWLAGIAAGGASVAGLSALTRRSRPPGPAAFAGMALLQAVSVPMSVLLVRLLPLVAGWTAGGTGPEELPGLGDLAFLCLVAVALPAWAAGAAFPVGVRAARSLQAGLAAIFAAEAIGYMAGGLLHSQVLAGRTDPLTFGLGATAVAALLGGVALRSEAGTTPAVGWRHPGAAAALVLSLALAGVLAAGMGERWNRATEALRWRLRGGHGTIVALTESPFQHLVVGRLEDQYSLYGNGAWAGSFPDPYSREPFGHFLMLLHPSPRRVLLLGGGPGGLLAAMASHPGVRVDYVEPDPSVLGTVLPFLDAADRTVFGGGRVSVLEGRDGRRVVAGARECYDLLVTDLPDPVSTLANRFFTRDFFEDAFRALRPGGVFVTGFSGSSTYLAPDTVGFGGSVYRALAQVFPEVKVAAAGERILLVAGRRAGTVTLDHGALEGRWEERAAAIPGARFSPYELEGLAPQERGREVEERLRRAATTVPANRDSHPVAPFHNLLLRQRAALGRADTHLDAAARAAPVVVLAVPGFLVGGCLVRSAWRRRGEGRRRSGSPGLGEVRALATFALAGTGLATMAIEVMVIHAVQARFGYLYREVGLLVALFMGGLAGGCALAGRRRGTDGRGGVGGGGDGRGDRDGDDGRDGGGRGDGGAGIPRGRVLAVGGLDLALALLAAMVPAVAFSAAAPVLWSVLTLAGLAGGLQFPLAAALLAETGLGAARTAARTQAADHLGAAAGALATGVLLLPLLGLTSAALLVAGVKAMGLLLLPMALSKEDGKAPPRPAHG